MDYCSRHMIDLTINMLNLNLILNNGSIMVELGHNNIYEYMENSHETQNTLNNSRPHEINHKVRFHVFRFL